MALMYKIVTPKQNSPSSSSILRITLQIFNDFKNKTYVSLSGFVEEEIIEAASPGASGV